MNAKQAREISEFGKAEADRRQQQTRQDEIERRDANDRWAMKEILPGELTKVEQAIYEAASYGDCETRVRLDNGFDCVADAIKAKLEQDGYHISITFTQLPPGIDRPGATVHDFHVRW